MMATIRRIPRGNVSTYGDIAKASGYPGGARQVVRALKLGKDLPWFRVVGAQGIIRLPGEAGLDQAMRLRAEGIEVRGRRIDLKRFGYQIRASDASTRSGT